MSFETFYSAWAWVENYLESPNEVNFYEAQPLNKLTAEVYQNPAESEAQSSDYKDAPSNELNETWNSHAEWFQKEPDLVPLQPILDSHEMNAEGYHDKPSGSQLLTKVNTRQEKKVQDFSFNLKPLSDGKKSKEISSIHNFVESKTLHKTKSTKPTSKRQEEKKPLRCQKCGKIFQRKDYFDYHLRVHADEEHLDFAMHGETSTKNEESTERAIFAPGKNGYVCNLCGKHFKTKFVFTQHSQAHAEKQSFGCEICPKQFKFKINLKRHLIDHSKDLHVCQHCKKAYKLRRNLISHQKYRGHFGVPEEKLRSFNEVKENKTFTLSNEKYLSRGISWDHAENSKAKCISTDESYNQVTAKFLNNLKEECTSFQDNFDNSFFLTPLDDSFASVFENNSRTLDYYPENTVNEYLQTVKTKTTDERYSWSPDKNYKRNQSDYFEKPVPPSVDSCSWSCNQESAASDSFKVPMTSTTENYLWPPNNYQNSTSTESCAWTSDYNQKYTANECSNMYYPDETQSFIYTPDIQEIANECSNALNATATDTWSTNYNQEGTIQDHFNTTISESHVRTADCTHESIIVENSNISKAIAVEGNSCIIQNRQDPLIQCNLSAQNISENKSCSWSSNNRQELTINQNLGTLNAIADESYLSMPNRYEETIVKDCSNRTTAGSYSYAFDDRNRAYPRAPNIMLEKYGRRATFRYNNK